MKFLEIIFDQNGKMSTKTNKYLSKEKGKMQSQKGAL